MLSPEPLLSCLRPTIGMFAICATECSNMSLRSQGFWWSQGHRPLFFLYLHRVALEPLSPRNGVEAGKRYASVIGLPRVTREVFEPAS